MPYPHIVAYTWIPEMLIFKEKMQNNIGVINNTRLND